MHGDQPYGRSGRKWQKVAESGRSVAKWQKCGRSGRRTDSRTRGVRKCGGQIRKRIAVREPSPFLKDVLPKTRHTPSRRMVRCRGEEVVKYKRIRDNALMTLFRVSEHVLKGLLPRIMQGVACWQTSYRWATLFIAGTLSRWPHVLLDPSLRKKEGEDNVIYLPAYIAGTRKCVSRLRSMHGDVHPSWTVGERQQRKHREKATHHSTGYIFFFAKSPLAPSTTIVVTAPLIVVVSA